MSFQFPVVEACGKGHHHPHFCYNNQYHHVVSFDVKKRYNGCLRVKIWNPAERHAEKIRVPILGVGVPVSEIGSYFTPEKIMLLAENVIKGPFNLNLTLEKLKPSQDSIKKTLAQVCASFNYIQKFKSHSDDPLLRMVSSEKDFFVSVLNEAIETSKKNFVPDELELDSNHTCPITKELFVHPVMDACGHTFERDAILRIIAEGGSCPLSRAPLRAKDLRPNLALKAILEGRAREACQNHTIPFISRFSGQKATHQFFNAAKGYADSGNFKKALGLYEEACLLGGSSEDYENVPLLFKKMKDHRHVISTLYWLKFLVLEKNFQKAIKVAEDLYKTPAGLDDVFIFLIRGYFYFNLKTEIVSLCQGALRTDLSFQKAYEPLAYALDNESFIVALERGLAHAEQTQKQSLMVYLSRLKWMYNPPSNVLVTSQEDCRDIQKKMVERGLALFRRLEQVSGRLSRDVAVPCNLSELIFKECPFHPKKSVIETHDLLYISKEMLEGIFSFQDLVSVLGSALPEGLSIVCDSSLGLSQISRNIFQTEREGCWVLIPRVSIPANLEEGGASWIPGC